jgi:signal transduction histidine kinase
MQVDRPRRRSVAWARLAPRTVRTRLTFIYGALFLVSGAALLTITSVLWGRATNSPGIIAYGKVSGRIIQIVTPAGARTTLSPRTNFTRVPPSGESLLPSGPPPRAFNQVVQQVKHVAAVQQSSDLHQLLLYSGIALGIMALIAVILGWLTAGRVLRPLRTITATAREISASNLHERLDLHGPDDELKRLGDTIDELLGRLEHSFDAQRLFVANASHELRTPLATMRASLDVALAKPGPIPEHTKRLAGRLHQELDQVDRLLESFLSLARAERAPVEEEVTVSLDVLVAGAFQKCDGAIAASALNVDVNDCSDALVSGNETLLARMVENLVSNAVSHNVRGGFIRVTTTVRGRTTRLVIENGGSVLEEDAVRELVQPFRRLGAARTGSENGSGLGLSIVAAIVETHGGRVELHAPDGGGIQVIVDLPLAIPAPVGNPA